MSASRTALLCLLVSLTLALGCGDRRRRPSGDGDGRASVVDAGGDGEGSIARDGGPENRGDGSAPDAGTAVEDAGFDGGPGDAGGRDAGGRDAGGRDAGGRDAGPGSCVPGLAAWWRFEETTGAVQDECGGHHGTAAGTGYMRGVSGVFGRAIAFDGSDGRVVVPASPDLDFVTAGTIELWVRVDGDGVGSTVSRGTGDADDNVLQNTSCWNMQTIFSRAGRGSGVVTSDCDALPRSEWAHVAVVNDGAELRLFIDGKLAESREGGNLGRLTTDLYFGRRQQGVFPLAGALDEVKWWTTARTAAEICEAAGGVWSGTSCGE